MKTKIIIFLSIFLFCQYINVSAQIPVNGLLAWYQFNGNAIDSSGNNNNGVINGPVPTSNRFGKQNKALLFNGNGDYVSVANDIWSTNLTLSAWIYASDFGTIGTSSGKVIFFKSPNTGYYQDYDLNVGYDANNNARVSFLFGQGSSQFINLISNTILQTNQWYLITATRENGVAKLYINANLDVTSNYTFTPVNQNFNLRLGMSVSNNQSFSGKLDELRIYNRALTIQEINSIYNEQPSEGLVAWYPFDGNASDSSGNNFNGSITGAVNTSDRYNYPDKALLFSGYGQYVDVPYNIWSENLTLSAWIYANDFGTIGLTSGKVIFFKSPNTGYYQDYDLNVGYDANNNARVSFLFGQGSSQFINLISNTVLQTNQWYLITATRENGVAKIYINGNLDITSSYTFTPINQSFNLRLGMSVSNDQCFSGKLDDLRIYNYALNSMQITGLFTNIDEANDTEDRIKIYPNPAKEMLTVDLQNIYMNKNTDIYIYNYLGQLIYQTDIHQQKVTININYLTKGIYFIKIGNDKQTIVKRFVKD